MPRYRAQEDLDADAEVAGLAHRADPYRRGVRRSYNPQRPTLGDTQFRGTPVPGYSCNTIRAKKGVVVRRMSAPGFDGIKHSCFVVSVGRATYLFNPNDCADSEVPLDGFERKPYCDMIRPMTNRADQIVLTFAPNKGECFEFANNLSDFWWHPSHVESPAERNRLLAHIIAVCCGAATSADWHRMLWSYQ